MGILDGSSVGVAVGWSVGKKLGTSVGLRVGTGVGTRVGTGLGDLDGGLVGKGVKVGAKVVGSMEGERSMWYLPAGHSRHEAASGKL